MGKRISEKKQLNNHGFSLLELLVVMAIIAVVTIVTMIGINVLYKGNAKKLNKNLYSTISELKTNTMSKVGDWQVVIKKDNGDFVISMMWRKDSTSEYIEKDSYRCGAGRISFTYENGTPSTAKADFSTDQMIIEYARDNGQVKAVKVGSDNYVNKDDAQSGIFRIKTSGTEYTSELWYTTGKVITTN